MTKKTKKTKTKKRSKRIRNKKNVSNKYFGGLEGGPIQPTNVLTTNPTTENTKPRPVAESVQNLANKTDAALNDASQHVAAVSEGANKAISGVTDGLNDASKLVDGAVSKTFENADKLSQGLNEGLDNVSNALADKKKAALLSFSKIKDELHDAHKNAKKNLTVKGLPHDIDELKEKYETSNDDEDIRNSLELENALKLHAQVEQILENPLIESLLDSSNEQVNEILASGMKMFGNAVTTAGESIPLVGEVVVLENMFRHFLYNMSDGSNAATKIEQKLDQLGNIVGDINDATKEEDGEKGDTPQQVNPLHILHPSNKIKTAGTNSTTGPPSQSTPLNETHTTVINSHLEELKKNMHDLEPKYDQTTEHGAASGIIDQKINDLKSELGDATKKYNDEKKQTDMTGGAMQHRINASIKGFLQSSILNAW